MGTQVAPRVWLTEFEGGDGARYAGPLLLADCPDGARALLTCVKGPNGQGIDLVGELVEQRSVGQGDTQSVVRRLR